MRLIVAAVLLLSLASCGEKEISLKVCPAVLAAADAPVPAGWLVVTFAGSQHAAAGTYHVREKPLLTEWNVVAAKTGGEEAGYQVTVRLNEYAKRALANYCADEANLKNPLALNVNGRWASFTPMLRSPGDRLTLHGLDAAEAQQLEQYVAVK